MLLSMELGAYEGTGWPSLPSHKRPFSLAMPWQTIYHDAVGSRVYWFVLNPAVI